MNWIKKRITKKQREFNNNVLAGLIGGLFVYVASLTVPILFGASLYSQLFGAVIIAFGMFIIFSITSLFLGR